MKNLQKDRLWVVPVILVAWLPYFMGAWDKTKPSDTVTFDSALEDIRDNWTVLESGIGAEHDFDSSTQTGVHTDITSTSIAIGTDGSVQGILTINDKDSNEFAYIKMGSSDGDFHYIFVDDSGDLRIHTAAPTASADGTVVGSQS